MAEHTRIKLSDYSEINGFSERNLPKTFWAAVIFFVSLVITVSTVEVIGLSIVCALIALISGYFSCRPFYQAIRLRINPMSEQVRGMSQVQLSAYRARFAWKRYERLLKAWNFYVGGLKIGYLQRLPNHDEVSAALKNAHDEVKYHLSVANHRLKVEEYQVSDQRIGSVPSLTDTLESLRTAEELLSNTSALGSSALLAEGDAHARMDVVESELAATVDSQKIVTTKPRPHQVETR